MVGNETTLVLLRMLDAPIEKVFAAWIDPVLLQQWFAPIGRAVRTAEIAARVGGAYRIEAIDSDWLHHIVAGHYEELIPNRLILKSWLYKGPDARPGETPSRLEVRFRPMPGGTEVSLRHELLRDEAHRERLRVAWDQCLAKLDALIRRSESGAT